MMPENVARWRKAYLWLFSAHSGPVSNMFSLGGKTQQLYILPTSRQHICQISFVRPDKVYRIRALDWWEMSSFHKMFVDFTTVVSMSFTIHVLTAEYTIK